MTDVQCYQILSINSQPLHPDHKLLLPMLLKEHVMATNAHKLPEVFI